MPYWEGVLSRLSLPGLILMAGGAVLCFAAPAIAKRLKKQGGERVVTPLKVAGLAAALLGALILLDVFPNL